MGPDKNSKYHTHSDVSLSRAWLSYYRCGPLHFAKIPARFYTLVQHSYFAQFTKVRPYHAAALSVGLGLTKSVRICAECMRIVFAA
ncbi:hypothetical protein AG1IA_00635 [Rhizoctonia solani AG-1 IA]|uniref:Uncharacterized protein n=1 Tax=Thanatephorus cucumeris (strain AG1-IA) TaxID=983506 RepID=L8X4W8_THACA|nr:hypothetical protein AG1IA_00635 [Rhizoctonia solani AG-1 IA]